MNKKPVFEWCRDKVDATVRACELGLEAHWLASKEMWLVCSAEDWSRVLYGSIVIC